MESHHDENSRMAAVRKSVQRTKKMEELCEMMTKRHAMEYAKLSKECEEVKQRDLESENETNEQVKDQGRSSLRRSLPS